MPRRFAGGAAWLPLPEPRVHEARAVRREPIEQTGHGKGRREAGTPGLAATLVAGAPALHRHDLLLRPARLPVGRRAVHDARVRALDGGDGSPPLRLFLVLLVHAGAGRLAGGQAGCAERLRPRLRGVVPGNRIDGVRPQPAFAPPGPGVSRRHAGHGLSRKRPRGIQLVQGQGARHRDGDLPHRGPVGPGPDLVGGRAHPGHARHPVFFLLVGILPAVWLPGWFLFLGKWENPAPAQPPGLEAAASLSRGAWPCSAGPP